MNYLQPYLIILSLLLFFSCRQSGEGNLSNNIPHTIQLEIQQGKYGRPDFDFVFTSNIIDRFGMRKLQMGYDSFYMRLWYPERNRNEILSIYYTDGKWSAEKIKYKKFTLELVKSIESLNIIELNQATPLISWKEFTDSLFYYGLNSFQGKYKLNGYCPAGGADGDEYVFELATRDRYRFFTYWSPFSYNEYCEEGKPVVNLLRFINKQFGVEGYNE